MSVPSKLNILKHCRHILEDRIQVARQAMLQAQESANQEDKSSAGDKYETSRAMGQLARDMNARQLQEALQSLKDLDKLEMGTSPIIIPGSLVLAENTWYMLATAIGKTEVDGLSITILSPASPLAKQLLGKTTGKSFLFRDKSVKIDKIL
ncbi:MAG: 3-oxoacyl-ACP synthase [Bacteroidia bacterium]